MPARQRGASTDLNGDRPLGLSALSVFFAAGALISGASALALAFPCSWLEPLWRLNPDAGSAFTRMGPWAILLMVAVNAACAGAAVGLWTDRRWGHRLAVGVLGTNLLGDFLNAVVRGDLRTLIGLPIGGAMLVYLLSRRIRYRFRPPSASESRSGGAPMDEGYAVVIASDTPSKR